jgi:hypothetical protein
MGTTFSSPSAEAVDEAKETIKKGEEKMDILDIEPEEELSEKEKYKKGRDKILLKIKNEKNYNSISNNSEALNKFADCLSFPSVLKSSYLNPNMTLTLALV